MRIANWPRFGILIDSLEMRSFSIRPKRSSSKSTQLTNGSARADIITPGVLAPQKGELQPTLKRQPTQMGGRIQLQIEAMAETKPLANPLRLRRNKHPHRQRTGDEGLCSL